MEVKKDENGAVIELHCTYDPDTRGGWSKDGRVVKGTSHWVSAEHAVKAEVRLYDYLFTRPDPEEGGDFKANLNPRSLEVLEGCMVEPSLADAAPGEKYQFLRQGYFCADTDAKPGIMPVFNRTVALRDSWAKLQKTQKGGG